MRRFLMLVNERARRGNALPLLQKVLLRAPLNRLDVVTAPFVDDAGVHRGLERIEDRIPVAVGGDGTVTSIARLLRAVGIADRPMGVLPLGTGNGLTHSLGIRNVRQATEALAHGDAAEIDVMVTSHPQAPVSLLNISVGLEALVMADFAAWRSRSLVLGGVIGAGRRAPCRLSGVTVEADGRNILTPSDTFYNVGLYNMPCYGFGVEPHPAADPSDGVADLRLHRGRLTYWAYMGAAAVRSASPLSRQPAWPRVRQATFASDLPVQMDGETLAPATFDVEVVPRGLRVLGAVRN